MLVKPEIFQRRNCGPIVTIQQKEYLQQLEQLYDDKMTWLYTNNFLVEYENESVHEVAEKTPNGKVEPEDQTSKDACVREILEETRLLAEPQYIFISRRSIIDHSNLKKKKQPVEAGIF
ncbi:11649_t:CDS:2 [Ambispora gerdemannii]|uniref:11649_t:CDS:1 n=1 Tax=Ambispora gerdemannii TaxID=144530 RepID=A0A9N9BEB9_9GLOM|nr:11649_t:CDS:2 [Ambispora gerdemannii]